MPVNKKRRFDVLKRDGFTCQYCGNKPPQVILEVDHILPVSKGGTDEILNLITSCFDCNRGKGKDKLSKVPAKTADEIEADKLRQEQLKEYEKYLKKIKKREEIVIDELGVYWYNLFAENKNKWTFGKSRGPSMRRFLKNLAPSEIKEAMEIAAERINDSQEYEDFIDDMKAWKYFCGVCWRKIKKDGDLY